MNASAKLRAAGQFLLVIALLLPLNACVTANEMAKRLGKPPEGAVELRAMQTRRFESADSNTLLMAATQTLQDLGYTISESSSEVGVLVASKQRDATEKGQVAGQIMLTVLLAAMGSYYNPVWDKDQTINVTLLAVPIENTGKTEIRVSFDRHMVNNHGHLWRAELILDPKIYQEFFDKLSQGAFLEAQVI